ncbi:MAG: PAS domain S-box protein, partial [Candidatus Hodarchaeales archaeon]
QKGGDPKSRYNVLVRAIISEVEHKRAEEALIKEKERAQRYLDIAAVIVVALNSKGTVILANRKACEILGYKEEEIVGKNWFDNFLPEKSRNNIKQVFDQLMKGERKPINQYYNSVLTKNGEEKIISWHNTALKDDSGRIIGTISSGNDITRQIQAEEKIKRLSSILQAIRSVNQLLMKEKDRDKLLEGVCRDLISARGFYSAIIVLLDNSGKITAFSSANVDESFTQSLKKMGTFTLPYCCQAILEKPGIKPSVLVFQNNKLSCRECQLAKDSHFGMSTRLEYGGKVFGVLIVAIPSDLVTGEEELSLMQDLGDDIAFTLNNLALEEALKESEAKHEKILRIAPVGIGFVKDRVIYWVSDNFLDMLGYSRDELIGKNIRIVFPYEEEFNRVRKEKYIDIIIHGTGSIDTRMKRKDGKIIDVYLRSTPLDPNDISKGVIFTVLDITSRKRAERKLKHSENRYRAVVEGQTELISRILPDLTHTFVNEAYCRYFGKNREELTGFSILWFVPVDEQDKIKQHMTSISVDNPVKRIEHRVLHASGKIRWLHWVNRGIFNEKGQLIEIQSVGRDITERKKIESELVKSEQNFRALSECANDGILIAWGDGFHVYANKRAAEITGYDVSELVKTNISDLLAPEEAEVVFERFKKRIAGENAPNLYETIILNKNGNRVPIEITVAKTTWQGEPANIVILRDITERKKAVKRLEESEKKYRQIFNAIPGFFFIFSDDGTILEFIGKEEDAFLDPDDLIGKPVSNIMPEQIGIRTLHAIKATLSTKKPQKVEYSVLLDGETTYFEGWFYYFLENRVMAFIRDVTEEKKTGEALWKSERKFKDLVKQSQDGICLTDENGRFIVWNDSMAEITGHKADDVLGKAMWKIFQEISPADNNSADHQKRLKEMVHELLSKGKVTEMNQLREQEILLKNGTKKTVENVVFPIATMKGYMIGTIVRDITASKLIEENLTKQKRELSQFAHFMTHDLRNNLNIIEGYAELLEEEYNKSHVDKIIKNARTMSRILNRSLELADAGLVIEKTDEVDLNLLVEEVADLTVPASIRFSHGKLPVISCDRNKMVQVFQNLLNNAVIHGKPGQIMIKARKRKKVCVISIINDGRKIPKKISERIFDQGYSTMKGSAGLGLTIVEKIIEAHNWRIKLQITPETCFNIHIRNEDLKSH